MSSGRTNCYDLPYVATQYTEFYFEKANVFYTTPEYMDVFDTVIEYCINQTLNGNELFEDATLWVESHFFIAGRHPDRRFCRLHPGAFLVKEKSLDRFYRFVDYCNTAYNTLDTPFRRWERHASVHPEDRNKLNRTYDWVFIWFTTDDKEHATWSILKQFPYYGEDFNPPYNSEVARHIVGELFKEPPKSWDKSWEALYELFRKGTAGG